MENLSNAILAEFYNLSTTVINKIKETCRSLTLDSNQEELITRFLQNHRIPEDVLSSHLLRLCDCSSPIYYTGGSYVDRNDV